MKTCVLKPCYFKKKKLQNDTQSHETCKEEFGAARKKIKLVIFMASRKEDAMKCVERVEKGRNTHTPSAVLLC